MIPDHLLPHTVQWSQPGTRTDGYGDTVEDWGNPVTADVSGRLVQRKSVETHDGQDVIVTAWVLFTNELGIEAGHRITHGTKNYEVDGDPLIAVGGEGNHHAEVALKKVS